MGGASGIANRLGAAARHPANWVQLAKFALVGASGYFVNLAVFALLVGNLGIHHTAAAVGAFCVAVTNNFLWNRHWTFGPGEGLAHRQAVRFLVVSVASLCLNLVVLQALIAAGLPEVPAQAIAVAAAMPFNFVGNRLWTFA
ncbi:MAG: GtrA family protein [Solirubrobacterales bacterium]